MNPEDPSSGQSEIPEPPRGKPRYSRGVTIGLGVPLVALLAVGPLLSLRDTDDLDRPVLTTIKVHEALLVEEAVKEPGLWGRIRDWDFETPQEILSKTALAYQQALAAATKDAGGEAPADVRIALLSRRAVTLAAAGRPVEARAALVELERVGPTGATAARVIDHAVLGAGPRPRPGEVDEAISRLAVAGASSEGWTAAHIRLGLHRRHGEQAEAAAVEADLKRQVQRTRLVGDLLIASPLLIWGAALFLVGRAVLRRRSLFPRLADALLPPPWPAGDGLDVAVRCGVMVMLVSPIAGLVFEKSTGYEGSAVGYVLGAVPGYLYIRRGLLAPASSSWGDAFGLARRAPWRAIIGCAVLLMAMDNVLALSSSLIGMRLGHHVPWTDLIDESLVTGAPLETAGQLAAMVIAAPIVEEIFYRGVVYGSLRTRMSPLPAAMLSALLFAVSHTYSPLALIHLFLGATVSALVYEWTRSLLPSIADHSVNNFMATAGDLALR